MVCDDSVVIRGAISRMLEADPAVRVVARVGNGKAALDELQRTKVDVLVLDIEMPVHGRHDRAAACCCAPIRGCA